MLDLDGDVDMKGGEEARVRVSSRNYVTSNYA